MTTISIRTTSDDKIEMGVERDVYGAVIFSLNAGDDRVELNVGHFYDDAEQLKAALTEAFKNVTKMTEAWEDTPEEWDAWLFVNDRGPTRYSIRLGSITKDVPTREIGLYELAAAMTELGDFPNVWVEGEDNGPVNLYKDIRPYHDDGGTDLVPLKGVEWNDGDEIEVRLRDGDWVSAEVIKDYGTDLGIVYCFSGDGDPRHTDDRTDIRRPALQWESQNHEDEPLDQQADLPGRYWAEIGPDARQQIDGWSWTIFEYTDDDPIVVASGFATGEDDAKRIVNEWHPPLEPQRLPSA